MTLLPMFGYSFKTTGCLLYPSSFACLNVPWSINSETIIKEKEEILGIKKKDSQGNYWLYALHKRWKWLKASAKFKTIMFLLITSFIFAIVIIKQNQKNQNFQGFLWIIMLGITGMLFILLQIPLLRFGIGYFISISTLFLSILLQENYLIINRILRGKENICYFISIILLSAIMVKNFNGKNILIPPLMPKVELIQAQKNDLQYVYPRNWTVKCWNAPLPCSPTLIKGNVSLKDSQKGLL